jgi:drug/metabolite transporter (DMT)-like permease
MVLVFVLYALFASVFTLGKTALGIDHAPFFLVGTRMTMAGILLLGYLRFFKKDQFLIKKQHLGKILLLGFIAIYLTNVCEFWGLQYLTSFKTCFIYSISPFASALLCYMLFKEKLTKMKWWGLIIGFAGFIPILLYQEGSEELSGNLFFFSGAEIAVIVAALSSVYGWILLSQMMKEGYSPLMINGICMLFGGVLALIHSLAYETWNPLPVTNIIPFLECTILLMIVSNFLAYNLYGYLLKRYSPTFMSLAGFTTPMFAALFGWIFLGETAAWPFFASSAVVFAGLYLFHKEELKQVYATAE